jgi:hypothetical protein
VVRNRGILTYVCVLALVIGGAGATLETRDESAAPVVQSWPESQGSDGEASRTVSSSD